ncbi:DUF2273 domain-containing protein [Paenibacillus melissococcoides]|uniref:DUF2273 domain-containing protein n=1 Tax=Paenibacillus melissococcoides TaxID=2912268 RepID=A0ABM9G2V4_9BACL|nr:MULTISPECIES: DUF2273 domain-containing protein [Paenibacillus]MEB9893877.1 DUF2273 domain-containing protein [Bacillus cereus]MBG9793543.1 hypothetical protein [Paenibacillus dendritiformis]CAH8245538.1 DUF2273 domain-containing protein [Paenibacillus melissococcoides]CAH8711243.1 DUF2273 domain-containing protein [Paenibacillus melissococcoides]CAH8712009.1 DUF2273 domain-containing protein [Paenibacillus melissococcoides]
MWNEWWESHRNRIIGIAAGIFFGVIYLIAGFWDMLFFALLVFIGYNVGRQKDLNLGPMFPWRRIGLWLSERFDRFK